MWCGTRYPQYRDANFPMDCSCLYPYNSIEAQSFLWHFHADFWHSFEQYATVSHLLHLCSPDILHPFDPHGKLTAGIGMVDPPYCSIREDLSLFAALVVSLSKADPDKRPVLPL
jgi:hypothetical protein